jgi:hypothetical protein
MNRKWYCFQLWPENMNQQFVAQVFAKDEQEAVRFFEEMYPEFRRETMINMSWPMIEPLKQHQLGWQPNAWKGDSSVQGRRT